MSKHVLIVLAFVAAIGGLVFADQVMSLFQGMTPLEMLQTLWTFVLHMAVTTALGYVVIGLPKIAQPWLRALRWKQKAVRRGRIQPKPAAPRAPRMSKDVVLYWLANQLQRKHESKATTEAPPPDEARIRFE